MYRCHRWGSLALFTSMRASLLKCSGYSIIRKKYITYFIHGVSLQGDFMISDWDGQIWPTCLVQVRLEMGWGLNRLDSWTQLEFLLLALAVCTDSHLTLCSVRQSENRDEGMCLEWPLHARSYLYPSILVVLLFWFILIRFVCSVMQLEYTVTPKTLSMFASNTVCEVWRNQGWESRFTLVELKVVSTPGYKSVPGSCDLVQWLWRYGQFEMPIPLKGFFHFWIE